MLTISIILTLEHIFVLYMYSWSITVRDWQTGIIHDTTSPGWRLVLLLVREYYCWYVTTTPWYVSTIAGTLLLVREYYCWCVSTTSWYVSTWVLPEVVSCFIRFRLSELISDSNDGRALWSPGLLCPIVAAVVSSDAPARWVGR